MADNADTAVSTSSQAQPKPSAPRRKRPGKTEPKAVPIVPSLSTPPMSSATSEPKTKKGAKVAKAKTPVDHPPFLIMVTSAIKELKDRRGASTQAITKYVFANNNLGGITDNRARSFLKTALKKGVSSGILSQTSGKGANGRFRVIDGKVAGKKTAPRYEVPDSPGPRNPYSMNSKAPRMRASNPVFSFSPVRKSTKSEKVHSKKTQDQDQLPPVV